MIVLDTHVLLWLADDDPKLGSRAAERVDRALQRDEVAVAAISFWEIAMLVEKRRLRIDLDAEALRREILQQGIVEAPLTGEIAVAAARLKRFHGDPADRMIVATAQTTGAPLVTADRSILAWSSGVKMIDARR